MIEPVGVGRWGGRTPQDEVPVEEVGLERAGMVVCRRSCGEFVGFADWYQSSRLDATSMAQTGNARILLMVGDFVLNWP